MITHAYRHERTESFSTAHGVPSIVPGRLVRERLPEVLTDNQIASKGRKLERIRWPHTLTATHILFATAGTPGDAARGGTPSSAWKLPIRCGIRTAIGITAAVRQRGSGHQYYVTARCDCGTVGDTETSQWKAGRYPACKRCARQYRKANVQGEIDVARARKAEALTRPGWVER